MGIPMLKIRRSQDRLIFNMGIPILVIHLYVETDPWFNFVFAKYRFATVNDWFATTWKWQLDILNKNCLRNVFTEGIIVAKLHSRYIDKMIIFENNKYPFDIPLHWRHMRVLVSQITNNSAVCSSRCDNVSHWLGANLESALNTKEESNIDLSG